MKRKEVLTSYNSIKKVAEKNNILSFSRKKRSSARTKRLRGLDVGLNAQHLHGTGYSNGVHLNFVRCISEFSSFCVSDVQLSHINQFIHLVLKIFCLSRLAQKYNAYPVQLRSMGIEQHIQLIYDMKLYFEDFPYGECLTKYK